MRMLIEIRLLGLRVVIDPKTVEALLVFVTDLIGLRASDEKSASSERKPLE